MDNVKNVSKNITAIILVFSSVLLTVYLHLSTIQGIDFTIQQSNGEIIIELKNRTYLVLSPVNDVIDDQVGNRVKLFQNVNEPDISYTNSSLNILQSEDSIDYVVQKREGKRSLELKREGNNVKITIDIESEVVDGLGELNYYLQFDYSVQSEIRSYAGRYEVINNSCKIEIEKDNLNYKYNEVNNQSIQIFQTYKTSLNFQINLKINCD